MLTSSHALLSKFEGITLMSPRSPSKYNSLPVEDCAAIAEPYMSEVSFSIQRAAPPMECRVGIYGHGSYEYRIIHWRDHSLPLPRKQGISAIWWTSTLRSHWERPKLRPQAPAKQDHEATEHGFSGGSGLYCLTNSKTALCCTIAAWLITPWRFQVSSPRTCLQ